MPIRNNNYILISYIWDHWKVFDFFFNYLLSVFSRPSGIDCTKPIYEIRPGTRFSSLLYSFISIFVSVGQILYMDQNLNKLEKACSRSNFEKRFSAIDSWQPGKCFYREYIIRKKIGKLFLRSIISHLNELQIPSLPNLSIFNFKK